MYVQLGTVDRSASRQLADNVAHASGGRTLHVHLPDGMIK